MQPSSIGTSLCYSPTVSHAINRISASPRIRLKLRFQRKPLGEVPYYERIRGFNLDGCLSSR